MPRECLAIIESKSKVCFSCNKPVVAKVSTNTSTFGISPDVAELKDMVKALLLDKKNQNQSSATVKAVKESYVTCGGAHSYRNYSATDAYQAPAPQTQGVSNEDFSTYVKANDAVMRNMQTQGQNMQNQLSNLTDLITKFMNSNRASTSSLGTLPSNIIANPRSDLKAITTRSAHPTNNRSTKDVQPQDVQSKSPILTSKPVTSPISEPVIAPVSAPKPNPKSLIPYPSRRNDERNREKANNQIEKFYQIFKDMSFEISFVDALILIPKFASTLKALIGNKEKLSEMARTPLNEHCSVVLLKKLPKKLGDLGKFLIPCDFLGITECLALADLGASINLMPFFVWKRLSLLDLTATCMTLELADHSISHPVGVVEDVYVKVGELTLCVGKEAITFNLDQPSRYSANYSDMTAKRIDVIDMACEEYSQEVLDFFDVIASGNPTPYYDLIVSITSLTLTPFRNNDFLFKEVDAFLAIEDDPTSPEFYQPSKSDKSSIDEPPEVVLKNLPPHLEYAFLESDDKLPDIIAKDLSVEEKTALITEPCYDQTFNENYYPPNSLSFLYCENSSMEVLLAKERILKLIQDWDDKQIESWILSALLLQLLNDSRTINEMLKQREQAANLAVQKEQEEQAAQSELMPTTINSFPRPLETFHANTIIETLPSSPILIEDSDSFREEIDIFTGMDDLLPLSIESDDYDSEGDIHFIEELLSNDSISLPENESSNFDNLSFPRPPPEPPDVEVFFDFEPNYGVWIAVVMNNIDELNEDECFDPGGEINYLIYPEDSSLLLFTGSEGTIFNPVIST
nr:reverse transcriptase domain-containing protein [Tanacetum cinerariifolium]